MTFVFVDLRDGRVRGERLVDCDRFRSIPYAAAPVGGRRFAAPQPVKPWDGDRDCTQPGPSAPQRLREIPGLPIEPLVGTGWTPGNDYLALNLWRPLDTAKQLPVMVFVHGGAFVGGSKDAAVQDGSTFARDGVLCVVINYRTGVDGFLPIPGVPTNLGLRDIVAALHWVRENVAAFGGDPANVTLFGESAGAMAVASLLTSPLATGLFQRAIVQSGHGAMTRPVGIAQRLTDRLAHELGIGADRAGFERIAPGEQLFTIIDAVLRSARPVDFRDDAGHDAAFGITGFLPVHGDDVLPIPPELALSSGAGKDVDLVIGTNAEEMNLYLVPFAGVMPLDADQAVQLLQRSDGRARDILKSYGLDRTDAGAVYAQAMTDLVFRWPARRFAERHQGRTFVYEFDWRSPAFEGKMGAAHGLELPFVFDALQTMTGPHQLLGIEPPQALAGIMHRTWIDFARRGAVDWPSFDADIRQVHHFGSNQTVRERPLRAAAFDR